MKNTADERITQDEQYDVLLEDVETDFRPRKIKTTDKKDSKSISGWQYTAVAGQIGFDIALPMVLGLIVGVKLDERWGTRPKATLILFCIGVVISCASLIRIVRDAFGKR